MASILNQFLPDSFHFTILQVEAFQNEDGGWTYNNTIPVGSMDLPSDAAIPTEFVQKLHELGALRPGVDVSTDEDLFEAKRHTLYVRDESDILELCDGKTDEPLYAAFMA